MQTVRAPLTPGNRVAPVLLVKRDPEYSPEARAAKYQGTVVLYVTIGTDGLVRNIKVLKSLGLGLDEKAIEAVQGWRFKPAQQDGNPIEFNSAIEMNFRMQ